MCGRYTIRRLELILAAMDAALDHPFEEFTERPRFNVAPSQTVPIVRLDRDGRRVVCPATWGFVPAWTKGKPKFKPINAKSETISTNGMFREAFARRRCLVPADGFFEWKGATPPKQPYFIHRLDDSIFAIAGVWERWRETENSKATDTFALLLTTPNELMRDIHDRMPVILKPGDYEPWLDPQTSADALTSLFAPHQSDGFEAYPVSPYVNTPKNDDVNCLKPLR